jgi:hypothetical protein
MLFIADASSPLHDYVGVNTLLMLCFSSDVHALAYVLAVL